MLHAGESPARFSIKNPESKPEKEMKSQSSAAKSAISRLDHLRSYVDEMNHLVGTVGLLESDDVFPEAGERIGRMRDLVAKINQCFHEFNAYRNVLVTE